MQPLHSMNVTSSNYEKYLIVGCLDTWVENKVLHSSFLPTKKYALISSSYTPPNSHISRATKSHQSFQSLVNKIASHGKIRVIIARWQAEAMAPRGAELLNHALHLL